MTSRSEEDGSRAFGHPRALYVLFFAEMWERFSYYGMRALLIFYLLQHWGFAEAKAYAVYGAYTALVYIAPLIGGYIADRYLGARRAVLFGAVLLCSGHGLMTIEGDGGPQSATLPLFWTALALIIVGTGFLKANISVLVGHLYPLRDGRRDSAFTIFYVGINLGAALGALVAGYLGQTYGWRYGFGAAGIGMVAGLLVFVRGLPLLGDKGEAPDPAWLAARRAGIRHDWMIYAGGGALVLAVWWLIQHQAIVGGLLAAGGAAVVLGILWSAVFRLAPAERDQILLALALVAISVLFWALYEQAGSSLNVYTQEQVDRRLLGIAIPAAMFQSLPAIYVVLLGPGFAALWPWLARRGVEPAPTAKFAIALIALGAGFLLLVVGDRAAGVAATPVAYIFLLYLLHTIGELCLSPVGLSAMTRLAPAQLAGLMMGVWFLATAGGNYTAGLIAQAAGGGQASDVYAKVGGLATLLGVLLLVGRHLARRRAAVASG